MKKFWTYVLTVYVTVVTIACAIFGALYFLSRNGKDLIKDLTYSEAKALVHEVYEAQVTNAESNLISANAYDYQDYNKDEIDYTGLEMPLFVYNMCLTEFEEAFQNNISANTWHEYQNDDESLSGFLYDNYRISIKGQTVAFELMVSKDSEYFQDDSQTEQPGDNIMAHYFEVTRVGESDWKVNYYERYYFNTSTSDKIGNKDDFRFDFWHFVFESENDKIFHLRLETFTSYLKVLKEEIAQSDFYFSAIFEYNLKTHKSLVVGGPEQNLEGGMPGGGEYITSAEAFSIAKDVYNEQKSKMGLYFADSDLK